MEKLIIKLSNDLKNKKLLDSLQNKIIKNISKINQFVPKIKLLLKNNLSVTIIGAINIILSKKFVTKTLETSKNKKVHVYTYALYYSVLLLMRKYYESLKTDKDIKKFLKITANDLGKSLKKIYNKTDDKESLDKLNKDINKIINK